MSVSIDVKQDDSIDKLLADWVDRVHWADNLMLKDSRKKLYKSAMPLFNKILAKASDLTEAEAKMFLQEMNDLRHFLNAGSLLNTGWIVKRLRGAMNGMPELGYINRPHDDNQPIVVTLEKPKPVVRHKGAWSQTGDFKAIS
jgi:hypothetical protein